MMRRAIRGWALCALVLGAMTIPASAQSYPTRTVRIVFGLSAGSSSDVMARIVAEKLGEKWGNAAIIDNRPGAGGNIAADAVSKSAPDGYTLLLSNVAIAIAPSYYRKLNYVPVKDFIPVIQFTTSPLLIVASAKTTITSLKDLITLAKQKPGELNFGSTGVGIPLHLTMEMLKSAAGIELVHVPFKGDAPLLQSLIAGDVQVACVPFATTLPHIQAGTLRALAVTTAQRVAVLSDVPTVAESGFPGFESSSWQGWFVPAGTPHDVVMKLNSYGRKALEAPDVIEKFKSFGNVSVGSSPEEFDAFFKADVAKFAKVVKEANIPQQD